MADDKTKRGSPDNKRLNKSEPYEMAYAKSKRATAAKKASAKKSAKKTSSAKTAAKKSSTRASAKKSSGGKTPAKKSSARSSAGKSTRGSASASPAMKRTNAEPGRKRAPTATTRGTPNPPKAEKTAENTAPRTMREGDAVDLLTDDHLQVDALFKQYEKLAKKEAPADQRRTLAGTICDMLKAHTTLEEEIFYPAARRAGIDADLLDEADIEHASAKDLIAQIEGGNPDDDHYDAKVKVLGEYITHHVVEEHTEMFTKCRRSGMDLVALRGELEARKMSLLPEGGGPADEGKDKGKSTGLLASLFAK